MPRRVSLLLIAVLAFGLVSPVAAQQEDSTGLAPNPLVQRLQNNEVVTAQEAAAINQAPTAAEQQERLTQLLRSKGIVLLLVAPDEYKNAAPAEASRDSSPHGFWLQAAAHVSAGEPDAAVATAPPAPPAPSVIPAAAPVRVLTSDPPKPGSMVPDIKLGSGAKLKLYGFVKATAAYDTSNPYNVDFVLPGLDNATGATFPTSITNNLNSGILTIPGVGGSDFGPNGSPSFYLKGNTSRMGANFEWPDIAGGNNTLTGKIEMDFEGNFSRAQNRNNSSIRTRMMSIRLAYARVDHRFSDKTTGFFLGGVDWAPFGSSTVMNLLETTENGAFFGNVYERQAQFRLGLWHDFGGAHDFKMGFEPAIAQPGFGNNSTDVGTQLGVGERQGIDSARPEISGRVVFQWQLDKARGVPPAQIIFSGMQARDEQLVNRAALASAVCGAATTAAPFGVACPAGTITALLNTFPHGVHPSNERWGADAEFQLPTRWMTWVGKWYTGADLKYYFGSQLYSFFNDNAGLRLTNGSGTICNGGSGTNFGSCPIAFNVDASTSTGAAFVPFGFNTGTGTWQVIPQKPMRAMGGFTQLSFPLSRLFNANPAGRNAGWTIAFTTGVDEAKGGDVRVAQPAGGRNRADMVAGTLNWKLNQYFTFAYESSLYRSFTTCFPAGTGVPGATNSANAGGVLGPGGGLICTGTPYIQYPLVVGTGPNSSTNGAARAWHDFRNEFGPIVTF